MGVDVNNTLVVPRVVRIEISDTVGTYFGSYLVRFTEETQRYVNLGDFSKQK